VAQTKRKKVGARVEARKRILIWKRTIKERGLNPGIKEDNTRFVWSPQLLSATLSGTTGGTSHDHHVDAWRMYCRIYAPNSVERFSTKGLFPMFMRVVGKLNGSEVVRPKNKSGRW